MRFHVPFVAVSLALAGCGDSVPAPGPPPTPIVRLAAIPGRPAAGYFQLRIDGDRGALLSVTSPLAGRVEMHETMTSGNMTGMRPIARIAVRDGELLRFAPGGRHLMLYDLAPSVRPGGEVGFVLNFERGPPLTLDAEVQAAGGGRGD